MLWLIQPVFLFLGIKYLAPRDVALVLAVILVVRLSRNSRDVLMQLRFPHYLALGALLLLVSMVFLFNSEKLLKFYPGIMNIGMLLIFATSLLYPPSFIEILARATDPHLPQAAIAYTRSVTIAWCVFFALNGTIAFYTAIYADRHLWFLYNGIIAYILMGILFAGEWLLRGRLIRKHMACMQE